MNDAWKQIKPSFGNQVARSWYKAKGMNYEHAMYRSIFGDWPHCHLCGRKEDFLYNFTTLVWQYRNGRMVRVCLDHPKPNHPKDIDGLHYNELVDANTGLIVKLPSPPSAMHRCTRNVFHDTVLLLSYIFRFAWFLARDLWLWNVVFPIVMWRRTLKF